MHKVLFGALMLLVSPLWASESDSLGVAQSHIRPAKVLVLGDSLSAAHNLDPSQGWVAVLKKQLNEHMPGSEVINVSVSGATTAAGAGRLKELLKKHQPDWLLLQLGANDGLQGKPLGYIRANLRAMVSWAQDENVRVVVIGVQLPPNFGKRYTEPFFKMFEEVAEERRELYVPFILEGVAGNSELMQADGLHPKAEAKEIIFNNVWQVFGPALEAHQARP